MSEMDGLAAHFEQNRSRMRAVAFRILGSGSDADDAVQEAWLRLSRAGEGDIENLAGWLTTVVARICLDMLRSRKARREEPIDAAPGRSGRGDPEKDAVLADAVGVAMLVVLDRLAPAERVAFVLHDTFALEFDEVAAILDRSPAAARQLASRARRRVRGVTQPSAGIRHHRRLVEEFLAALRAGDIPGLLAVLDPDMVVRFDGPGAGGAREIRGASNWARGAVAFAQHAASIFPVLVNGSPGLIAAPAGKLFRAIHFTFGQGKITAAIIVSDPDHLRQLDLTIPNE